MLLLFFFATSFYHLLNSSDCCLNKKLTGYFFFFLSLSTVDSFFTHQVPLFELQDVTLLVHAYQKHNIQRKELIGWLALGANSSGEEQLAHWNEMMAAKGEQVSFLSMSLHPVFSFFLVIEKFLLFFISIFSFSFS